MLLRVAVVQGAAEQEKVAQVEEDPVGAAASAQGHTSLKQASITKMWVPIIKKLE